MKMASLAVLGTVSGLMPLFCVYGFMASFEPGMGAWKIIYAMAFVVSILISALAWRSFGRLREGQGHAESIRVR